MIRSLGECVILGVKTPIEFMIDVMSSTDFRSGNTHTWLIEEQFESWQPDPSVERTAIMGFVANELINPDTGAAARPAAGSVDPLSPWQTLGAWDMAR